MWIKKSRWKTCRFEIHRIKIYRIKIHGIKIYRFQKNSSSNVKFFVENIPTNAFRKLL